MVGAILCGKLHSGTGEGLAYGAEMGEGRGYDETYSGRHLGRTLGHGFCKFDSIGLGSVHLPVARNDFLSHFQYVLYVRTDFGP